MTGTDQIALFDDLDLRHRTAIFPWPHPWPPPERLALMTDINDGLTMLVPATFERIRREPGIRAEFFTLTAYIRLSYSKLPEDIALDPTSHVCRMAGYAKVPPMTAADEVSAIDGAGF